MRSFWTDVKRGLRHWVKPEFDTSRVARVYHHFDEVCRYREYLERCQAAMPEEMPRECARTVRERGFEHLRVMSGEQAAQFQETLIARARVAALRKSAGMVDRLHLDDPDLEEGLLSAVLPPTVAEKIRAFFGSEFFVYWSTVTRALPVREQTRNSFLWHCDRGPQAHLKLLTYLNGTREHGGNTELTDLETTRRMAATGYIFGSMDDRLEDLSVLARSAGIEFRPVVREIAAGEGILFQPARVLHRGLLPETTPRDVVTLCLLPSPVPWRQARAQGTGKDPETDKQWHDDAPICGDVWLPAQERTPPQSLHRISSSRSHQASAKPGCEVRRRAGGDSDLRSFRISSMKTAFLSSSRYLIWPSLGYLSWYEWGTGYVSAETERL